MELRVRVAALRRSLLVALLAATVGAVQAQQPSFNDSRSSSFTYKPNGLLETETVEPSPSDPNLCVVTTHSYDPYGNRSGTSSANCAGASGDAVFVPRNSPTTTSATQTVTLGAIAVVTPAGVFATSVSNALSHTENRTFDPRFGAMVTLTGPNGLTTRIDYDDFGRAVKETRADGTTTVTYHCILLNRGVADTSSNSAACAGLGSLTGDLAEIPADAISFVQSRAQQADGTALGPAARVYKDRANRVLREVAESFDGASQPVDRRFVAKDTLYDSLGRARGVTAAYFWAKGSSTVGGTGDAGSSYTQVDALGRVVQVDTVDPHGHYTVITAAGTMASARTTTVYNGLSTQVTNDLGQTRTEERYVNGKLARVRDAYGGELAHLYDAFDNLVQTQDALQNIVKVVYDKRGRKLSLTDPDSGTTLYSYNALGELVRQRSAAQQAAGTATTMSYDALGRLKQRVEPEYTTTWSYDRRADNTTFCMDTVPGYSEPGKGKLCEVVTSHGINKKFAYDALGRPKESRTTVTSGPSFGSSVAYDSVTGRVQSQVYPSGVKVQLAYTARGYLSQLQLGTGVTVAPLPATPGGTPVAGATLAAGTALWTAGTVNAWGAAESQTLANGVVTRAQFEAATGRVTQLKAGAGAATNVLNQAYSWDSLGNLSSRQDQNGDGNTGAVNETYGYDSLNRLVSYAVSAPQVPNITRSVSLYYNAIGNLLYKSDVGNYDYPAYGSTAGVSNPRPHAVSRVVGTSFGTVNYGYDANGNATSADGGKWRSVSYTSFNLPDSNIGMAGAAGSPRYTWQYDDNHQRIRETRVDPSGTRTTWFQHPDNVGGLGFEHEVAPSGALSSRHYLGAGGQTIVLVTTATLPVLASGQLAPAALASVAAVKLEYWHKDHLGSLVSTTDHLGNVTARYAYDPFGKRRFTNGQYDAFGTLVVDWVQSLNAGTDRGFTGHEHLDDLGVVHMNGRIFDPAIARFMQADPMVEAPGVLQSYNRYSYLWNNPLNGTDPSGFCFAACFWQPGSKDVQNIVLDAAAWAMRFNHYNMPGQKAIDRYIMRHPWANQVGQIVVTAVASYYGGPWAGAGAAATWTSYYTYQQTGDIKVAMRAGTVSFATSMAFYAVGSATTESGVYYDEFSGAESSYTSVNAGPNVLGHTAVGCMSAMASHSSCGSGAMSAGLGAAYSNWGSYSNDWRIATVQHAMVGGVSSVLGGGKFADGAKMAAFGYLFNHWSHEAGRLLAGYGVEAHQLLQDYEKENGYVVESKCATPTNCVDGRFDIADRNTKEVWEIKRNSFYGLAMGELALEAYTAPETGLRRGGDLVGLKVGDTLSLWKGDIEYQYTNYGDGSIGYSRFDHTPQQPIRIYRFGPVPGGSRGRDDQFGY